MRRFLPLVGSAPRAARWLLLLALVGLPATWLAQPSGAAAPAPAPASTRSVEPAALVMEQRSYAPGMKAVVGITGRRADHPVMVRVLRAGRPAPGETVEFRVVGEPSKGKGPPVPAVLSASRVVTDEKGVARVRVTLGDREGTYLVAAFLRGSVKEHPPVITRLTAMSSAWAAFLVFGLLGGLGLFLYGMSLAGDHLQKAAGEQMRTIIGKLTRNRVMGVLLGTVASGVLQSSSAATVMLVGFVSAGMMTLTQAISVTMGAKIGVTITAQLIAFDLSRYALAIVGSGAILIMAAGRRERLQHAGAILLGFGLIFFGLATMSSAMSPLRAIPEFAGLLLRVSESALLAVLLGAVFTAIIQSAVATVALSMALAAQGLLPLSAAIPLSMGAAIGTCATALLASLGANRDGKRVAVAHLLFSAGTAVVLLPVLGPFTSLVKGVTEGLGSTSVVREIANAYMLFSILGAVVFLPFVGLLERGVRLLIPDLKEEPPFGPKHLNDAALTVPVLALDQAQAEVERMTGIFGDLLSASLPAVRGGELPRIVALKGEDDKLDTLERAIRPFLAKVAQRGLDSAAAARQRGLIYVTEHLEGAGDLVVKEVLHQGERLQAEKHRFSAEGLEELERFHGKMVAKAERVAELIHTGDRALAEQILQLSFKEAQLHRSLRDSHLTRLSAGREETVATSRIHLTILAGLADVGRKLDEIAREIQRGW